MARPTPFTARTSTVTARSRFHLGRVALATGLFLSNPLHALADATKSAINPGAPAATSSATVPMGLLAVWQAVLGHDPELRAAQAERDASTAQREQASGLWKPQVVLQGTAGVARQSMQMNGAHFDAPGIGSVSGVNFATSVNNGHTTRVGLMLQQALFNPARKAQSQQLTLMADLGEASWQSALNQARLQTAERYLNLALADDRVRLLGNLERTLQQVSTEAQDRFQLGASPVTDTHEAKAELAKAQAQRLAAQLDADTQRQQLATASGLWLRGGPTGKASEQTSSLPWPSLEVALQNLEQSPDLKRASLGVAMAEQEVARTRAGAETQVNLVAQSAQDRISGNGDFGSASNRNTQHMIGIQATVPLYTGGMQGAQHQAAVHKLTQAQARRDAVRAQLEQQLRQSWQAHTVANARVQALQAALKASGERLAATKLGREVGDRTTLDVLNAENAHANGQLALAEAQVQRVLMGLRVAALTGGLNDGSMQGMGLERVAQGF